MCEIMNGSFQSVYRRGDILKLGTKVRYMHVEKIQSEVNEVLKMKEIDVWKAQGSSGVV